MCFSRTKNENIKHKTMCKINTIHTESRVQHFTAGAGHSGVTVVLNTLDTVSPVQWFPTWG